MWARLANLPLLIVLTGIGALAMYIPAVHGALARDLHSARAYFYSATIFIALVAMVAIATSNYAPKRQAKNHLFALLAAFVLLPVMLAFPLWESIGNTRFLNAYFEMVSSLTTTGATVFEPERLVGADHLWRGLVGWMGGFLIWVSAIAVLAPLNLGGFEVLGASGANTSRGFTQIVRIADASVRLQRFTVMLLPIYAGLTLVLWVGLLIAGDPALVAVIHAMSTLATSGISPIGGTTGAASGFGGELLIFLFFAFAMSRQIFARDTGTMERGKVFHDPELRMALFLAAAVPMLLFLRHWAGAIEVDANQAPARVLQALWGGVFTVVSFLSTTGFESASWGEARNWSGLETPGLILLGLAMVGGGVATTAGGVKLLRVYALFRHGQRELERLVHPNSVGGSGQDARFLRKQGAFVAWIFFMLFAISIAVIMLALSLTGIDFEPAVVLTIAALSTTGPLVSAIGEISVDYATLPDIAKLILCASMVLGRLETLAIIALFNPGFWRN